MVDIVPIREKAKKNLTIKVWGTISHLGVGPLIRYYETMNATKYEGILDIYLLQEYSMLNGSEMEEEGQEEQ